MNLSTKSLLSQVLGDYQLPKYITFIMFIRNLILSMLRRVLTSWCLFCHYMYIYCQLNGDGAGAFPNVIVYAPNVTSEKWGMRCMSYLNALILL